MQACSRGRLGQWEREIGRAFGFRQGCGVPLMSGMGEGLRDE